MAESAAFPYETRLNVLHKPLELIDVHAVPGANEYKWFNQTLCKVNDSVVRMAAIEANIIGTNTTRTMSFSTWLMESC